MLALMHLFCQTHLKTEDKPATSMIHFILQQVVGIMGAGSQKVEMRDAIKPMQLHTFRCRKLIDYKFL